MKFVTATYNSNNVTILGALNFSFISSCTNFKKEILFTFYPLCLTSKHSNSHDKQANNTKYHHLKTIHLKIHPIFLYGKTNQNSFASIKSGISIALRFLAQTLGQIT